MSATARAAATWAGKLTLAHVLRAAGIEDLRDVLVIRHTFANEPAVTVASATAGSVLAYTRSQSRFPGKFPSRPPRYWVVLLKDGKSRSRLFQVYENFGEIPEEVSATSRFFDLRESDLLEDLRGRLVIEWGGDPVNWVKRGQIADRLDVAEISDPAAVPFPGFDKVELPFAELQAMVEDPRYAQWRTALQSVQGIYVIADTTCGKLYVGKADGGERILGRWRDYAQNGHGGNLGLKAVLHKDPDRCKRFTWSLLRVFGPDATPDDVLAAEEHFKRTLQSRAFGYNEG